MIAGDKGELIWVKLEVVTAVDILIKSALGEVLIESVTGAAELRAALGGPVDGTRSADLLGGAIIAGAGGSQPVILGGPFQTSVNAHTHLGTAPGIPTEPPIVLKSVTPGLPCAVAKVGQAIQLGDEALTPQNIEVSHSGQGAGNSVVKLALSELHLTANLMRDVAV